MINMTRAYQTMQNAQSKINSQVNVVDTDIGSPQNTDANGVSFSEILKKNAEQFMTDTHHIESKVKDYTLGRTTIENVALPVREYMLEFEGAVSIVKASTEAVKNILQTPL
jgi:flagellar hook-basal body complex protein FliE